MMDDSRRRSESSASSAPTILSNPTSTLSSSSPRPVLWRLYISHTLSTWNARTFEFGAVIFLAAIFPGTLFFASCYALFRSAVAALLGSWIGLQVDRKDRLHVVRQSIVWQRLSVAGSCLVLYILLDSGLQERGLFTYLLFITSVVLACFEKLAFMANTVAVERDWVIVVADSLQTDRQELNSAMRRIDLACKLIAPVCIGLIDGYSTKIAVCVVFVQNALSVLVEYYAIAQVYSAVPYLSLRIGITDTSNVELANEGEQSTSEGPIRHSSFFNPWIQYVRNPAFLASFALSLLYLTVLSFGSQMTTYLLTLGFTSTHVSILRLFSVALELSATCLAPYLATRIGHVRTGLWFINEQLVSICLAIGLFFMAQGHTKLAGASLVFGVCVSRIGLWGFDLCVQYLVQEDAPPSTRGSFSSIEMSLQNVFELLSFATTMVFYRPQDFHFPIYISAVAVATSACCFAGFVRQKRGHLMHTEKCLRRDAKKRYRVLPTIEEEDEDGRVDSAS